MAAAMAGGGAGTGTTGATGAMAETGTMAVRGGSRRHVMRRMSTMSVLHAIRWLVWCV